MIDTKKVKEAHVDMEQYIESMINLICTGDEKTDLQNMQDLADTIYERTNTLYNAQLHAGEAEIRTKKSQRRMTNKLITSISSDKESAPSKEDITKFLHSIRNRYYEQRAKGMSH